MKFISSAIKKYIFIARVGLTVAILLMAISTIDLFDLFYHIKMINYPIVGASMLLLAMQVALHAYRWIKLIPNSKSRLGYYDALAVYGGGVFFNLFLPSGNAGDIIRIFFLKKYNFNLTEASFSVIGERIYSLAAMLLIMLFVPSPFMTGLNYAATYFALGAIVLTVLFAYFYRNSIYEKILSKIFFLFGGDWRVIIVKSFVSVFYGLFAHLLFSLSLMLISAALSIEMGLNYALAISSYTILATLIPLSIGGWGIRELTMATLISLFNIASFDSALFVAIFFSLLLTTLSVASGIFFAYYYYWRAEPQSQS